MYDLTTDYPPDWTQDDKFRGFISEEDVIDDFPEDPDIIEVDCEEFEDTEILM